MEESHSTMTVTLRSLSDADLDIADALVAAAYNAPHSRKDSLQLYMHLQPDGWMLAALENQPVGLGGLVNYGPFAYLGMMSVLPAAQGKGIGKELMKHLLKWAEEKKCPTIFLDATEAGSSLYQRFGFVEENKTQQWQQKRVGEGVVPHRANGNITEIRASDLPVLTAFDALYFGAQRVRVFEAMLKRYPQRALAIWDEAGQMNGYLFAQQRSIGPWVARTVEDAEHLLAQALTLPFVESMVTVNLSAINDEGAQLLERYGFCLQRTLSYMRRGTVVSRDLQKIYGQASFALG